VKKALIKARQPVEALEPLQETVEELQVEAEKPVERQTSHRARPVRSNQPLRLGERVTIRSLKTEGIVTALSESEIEVQIGNLRLRARNNDIQRKSEPLPDTEHPPLNSEPSEPPARTTGPATLSRPSPGMELDLRGQRAEDALEALDRYIENAYLVGMPFVRIIHGKGTGRLRQVIRDALRQSTQVKSFEQGLENEGGDGVTVAHLAVDD
jgi:DNA mismatch repair protein MutS2